MKQTLTISLLTEAQNGSFGKNEVQSMTRAEAVDRMADAIVKKIKEMGNGAVPIFLAEAALDALLGVKK